MYLLVGLRFRGIRFIEFGVGENLNYIFSVRGERDERKMVLSDDSCC